VRLAKKLLRNPIRLEHGSNGNRPRVMRVCQPPLDLWYDGLCWRG